MSDASPLSFGDEWEAEATPAATAAPADAPSDDHRALYLRWRPRRFEDVVGQDHVTRTLRNAVVRGRLAHAYLFTGPRGTGKTSVARILYRAANCEHAEDGDPCNRCSLCRAALDGRALDLVEIDAASNNGIDDIRDLRDKVAYRPSVGRFRLYILDEAHELSRAAWDGFLKTLEEPPDHVLFVMATTEAHKIPATIVSRCQRFDFRRIPFEGVRDQLARISEAENLNVEPAVLERLARSARGGMRDAESLLDQLSAFAGGRVDMEVARAVLGLPPAEVVHATVEALGARDASAAMSQVLDVAEGGADLRQFVEELISNLRALLLVRSGADAQLGVEFPPEEVAWLHAQAPAWPSGALIDLVQSLSTALVRTRDAQQFQVQVELALLGVCQGGAMHASAFQPAAEPAPSAGRVREPAPAEAAAPRAASRSHATPSPRATSSVARSSEHRPPAFANSESPNAAGELPAARAPEPAQAVSTQDGAVEVADVPAAPAADEPLDIDIIRQRWADVIETVVSRKPLVGSGLRTARPLRVEGQVLVVDFGTSFAVKTAERSVNRAAIEEGIRQVLGRPFRLRCTVGEEGTPNLFEDPVISAAVRMFGGEPRLLDDAP